MGILLTSWVFTQLDLSELFPRQTMASAGDASSAIGSQHDLMDLQVLHMNGEALLLRVCVPAALWAGKGEGCCLRNVHRRRCHVNV